jgi:hypothetical protein
MNRAAAGHIKDQRIVFNVGSELIAQLCRAFEFDEELNVDNDCGGDQRYNLQGTFDKPELWKLARHNIAVRNVCFVKDVAVAGEKQSLSVTWKLQGAWSRDPQARLAVILQQVDPATGRAKDVAVLRKDIPPKAEKADVDVSSWNGKSFRIAIRKVGDPETGGSTPVFELN